MGCTWQQVPATLHWTTKGRDLWATFAPSPEKPGNSRRESLTGCNHLQPPASQQRSHPQCLYLLLPIWKDLVRIYSELQRGWTPPKQTMLPRRMRHTEVLVSQQCSDVSRHQDHNRHLVHMCCYQFMVQHDIHVPPAAKSKIPRSGATTVSAKHTLSEQRSLCTSHLLLRTLSELPLTPQWGTLVLHSHHTAYTAQSCSYCLTTWTLVTSRYGSQVCSGRLIGLSLWLIECTKTYCGVKMTYFRTINKEKKCILKCGALLLKLSILSGVLWEL